MTAKKYEIWLANLDPRVGTDTGRMALIAIPPINEQKRIVDRIEELLSLTNQIKDQIIRNQDCRDELVLSCVDAVLSDVQLN